MGKVRAIKKVTKAARRKQQPLSGRLGRQAAGSHPRAKESGESLHIRKPSEPKGRRSTGAHALQIYAEVQSVKGQPLQIRNPDGSVEVSAGTPYGSGDMSDSFGVMLRNLIEASGMTQAQFAEKAGVSASFVSNVIAGDRTPPPDKHEAWADILGIDGRIRDRFLDRAMLVHLPKAVRPRFRDLLRRLEKLESDDD